MRSRVAFFAGCLGLGACSGDEALFGASFASQGGSTESSEATGPGSESESLGAPEEGEPDADSEDAESEESGEPPKFDLAPAPDTGAYAEIPEDCEVAENVDSTVGCLFFAVHLPNSTIGQFSVIVSNVQDNQVAEAVVEIEEQGEWVAVDGPAPIGPLDSLRFDLPDRVVFDSVLSEGLAYRVRTDVPVVAYQFNPVDGETSHTTDASMLYPVSAWDYVFRALGFPVSLPNRRSYVDVVAAFDGTVVEVIPDDPTVGGAGIPTGQSGVPFEVELDAGDVAQISIESLGHEVTGLRLESDPDHPIGVFSGTACTNTGQGGACDHLEEMITGLRVWGETFVATRMPVRRHDDPEPTVWQLYASEANTSLSVEAGPGVVGTPPDGLMMSKGQVFRFPVTGSPEDPGDFVIRADRPIGLVAYMIGLDTDQQGLTAQGDPAMLQISPVDQFLPRYVVLVPDSWNTDWLIITRRAGDPVLLDGVLITDDFFISVGLGEFEVARMGVNDGVHVIDGMGLPIGVSVVGYDSYDSYAYLGGVGTAILNPSPAG